MSLVRDKEKVFFDNGHGDKLCGLLQLGSGTEEGKGSSLKSESSGEKIVILAHGFSSSKDSKTYTKIAEALLDAKIGSFRFDFYGHGESEGGFSKITLTEGVEDVMSAFRYLKKRFPKSQIGLLGSSFGGGACFYAIQSLNVVGSFLICPSILYKERYDKKIGIEGIEKWKRDGSREYKTYDDRVLTLDYSFYESLSKWDGVSTAQTIKTPVCILHGDNDTIVDHADSVRVTSLLGNGRLITIHGADHFFRGEGEWERVTEEAVAFFKKIFNL